MDASPSSSLVDALVVAVCTAALAGAGIALHAVVQGPASPARPAADTPVDVVKAPSDAVLEGRCTACATHPGRGPL